MLDFGGIAQKLWVFHCLDSFLPFLSVANLGLHSSFVVSRLAYLGFQSKEIVIVCYLTQVATGLRPSSILVCCHLYLYRATVMRNSFIFALLSFATYDKWQCFEC